MNTKKAVILLSGGQDSSTCLALAKAEGFECYALSISYGQNHSVELEAAKTVASKMGVKEHKIITINLSDFGGSALTDDNIEIPDYTGDGKIPTTYVPARNTIFLSLALGYAEVINADTIYIGCCLEDYSAYVDCRPEFINAYQAMANFATAVGVEGNGIKIVAPLLHLSKAETIKLGLEVGVDYGLTITCYRANEKGQACGSCTSCTLRKNGFKAAGVSDPTAYV